MRFGQVNVHGRENPVFSSGVSGVIPPRARAERSWRQLRAQFFLWFLGCFQLGNLKMSHIIGGSPQATTICSREIFVH